MTKNIKTLKDNKTLLEKILKITDSKIVASYVVEQLIDYLGENFFDSMVFEIDTEDLIPNNSFIFKQNTGIDEKELKLSINPSEIDLFLLNKMTEKTQNKKSITTQTTSVDKISFLNKGFIQQKTIHHEVYEKEQSEKKWHHSLEKGKEFKKFDLNGILQQSFIIRIPTYEGQKFLQDHFRFKFVSAKSIEKSFPDLISDYPLREVRFRLKDNNDIVVTERTDELSKNGTNTNFWFEKTKPTSKFSTTPGMMFTGNPQNYLLKGGKYNFIRMYEDTLTKQGKSKTNIKES